jgi:hypothetical protein
MYQAFCMIAFDIERILYTEHLGWGRLQRAETLVPAVSFHSAECSPAERVDDPAVGLVAISGGVDRQTLELLDRDD